MRLSEEEESKWIKTKQSEKTRFFDTARCSLSSHIRSAKRQIEKYNTMSDEWAIEQQAIRCKCDALKLVINTSNQPLLMDTICCCFFLLLLHGKDEAFQAFSAVHNKMNFQRRTKKMRRSEEQREPAKTRELWSLTCFVRCRAVFFLCELYVHAKRLRCAAKRRKQKQKKNVKRINSKSIKCNSAKAQEQQRTKQKHRQEETENCLVYMFKSLIETNTFTKLPLTLGCRHANAANIVNRRCRRRWFFMWRKLISFLHSGRWKRTLLLCAIRKITHLNGNNNGFIACI